MVEERSWKSVRANRAERTRELPGDELIPRAIDTLTHGVTVRRAPRDVWPWLLQMGAGSRGGWYSYDWLDNGRQPSATRIAPELQHPAVGTIFPALPGVTDGFTVLAMEPERVLMLGWLAPDRTPEVTWTFVLDEVAPCVTRLLVRARGGPGYRFHRLPLVLTRLAVRVVHFVMQRKQLLGIAERAEKMSQQSANRRPSRTRAEDSVPDAVRVARHLTTALIVVMVIQAATGLLFQTAYRDVDWIRATWFGNDWVTLVVAVPLLTCGLTRSAAGSVRGLLLWLGLIGYALYNYAFYLFGAALNAFFPIYVAAFVLAAIVLVLALSQIDLRRVADGFRPTAPVRLIGGSLVFVGTGFAFVWIAIWAAYVFAGRPTPVEPEAFKLVAALDLSIMVPVLTVGGVLIWKRAPWGVVIAAIASIQACLYLFVLSVNSAIAIQRGLASAPDELPVWGLLTIFTTAVALLILANVQSERIR